MRIKYSIRVYLCHDWRNLNKTPSFLLVLRGLSLHFSKIFLCVWSYIYKNTVILIDSITRMTSRCIILQGSVIMLFFDSMTAFCEADIWNLENYVTDKLLLKWRLDLFGKRLVTLLIVNSPQRNLLPFSRVTVYLEKEYVKLFYYLFILIGS